MSDIFFLAPPDDPHVEALIRAYDRRNVTDRNLISELLRTEHNIYIAFVLYISRFYTLSDFMVFSSATVSRRRERYGLKGSGATTRELPLQTKRQLVLDQMAKDPTSRQGPKTIKEGIVFGEGIHLTRYACH